MNNKLAGLIPGLKEPDDDEDDAIGWPLSVGIGLFALVFGGFGLWSALAPLEGAAQAPGVVTVATYSKTVQHLEGGIISDILVANGDRVTANQALIDLDETQSLAQLEIAQAEFASLAAREARLIAERDGLDAVEYPAELAPSDPESRKEIAAQNEIFESRKATMEGSTEVLEQRIEQLHSKVSGLEALKRSKEVLSASFAEELEDTRALLDQGFSDRTRLRELERAHATHSGEVADLTASISSTEIQVGETRMQILQEQRVFLNEVVAELAEVQTGLNDVNERIVALRDVVARTVVRAPVAGIVNGMQFHTVGGVISPGTPIVNIVPEGDDLIVEARVSTNDIDRVAINQNATIRFSTFGNSVPTTFGRVINISADSFTDENTSISYYLARVEVTSEGQESLGDLTLLPGMPAEVFISTGSRTFLQYLFKPISNALARSFNED